MLLDPKDLRWLSPFPLNYSVCSNLYDRAWGKDEAIGVIIGTSINMNKIIF